MKFHDQPFEGPSPSRHAWRPSISQSTFAAETEICDQYGDLLAIGAGTFRYLKGETATAC